MRIRRVTAHAFGHLRDSSLPLADSLSARAILASVPASNIPPNTFTNPRSFSTSSESLTFFHSSMTRFSSGRRWAGVAFLIMFWMRPRAHTSGRALVFGSSMTDTISLLPTSVPNFM